MRYINIGSGSHGNATLILNEDTVILIDCGLARKKVSACLTANNRTINDIAAILITHRHSDHTSHLAAYKELNARLFTGDEELLEEAYRATNTLVPAQRLLIGSIEVTALPTSHDAPKSMGYLLRDTHSQERLLYMTDTGYVPEKDLAMAKNCDFYILESNHDLEMLMHSSRTNWLKMRILGDKGHLSNVQAAHYLSMLVGDKTREIALAHLSSECNKPELALRVLQQVMVAQRGIVPDFRVKTLKQDEVTAGGDLILDEADIARQNTRP